MNTSAVLVQIFGPFISNFWWLILLAIVVSVLKSPVIKGAFGEGQVNLAAKFLLDKDIYKLIKNVTLVTESGSTQIDHVIVSRYGVFVIETKNMKGWIFGDANQKIWTQKIYRHTTKFQNPLHQNYKHTQALQRFLALDPEKIFSLVVFVGDSSFKTPMPANVVYAGEFIRFIESKTQLLFSDSQVHEIFARLQFGRLEPTNRTHRRYVEHVKNIVQAKQTRHHENSCPNCGKSMVIRTARNGANKGKQFWGCNGFPKCRAIKQINT
ncbi:NERD domain-containing protein [Methylomonas sp. TEB]|uniref:nuclease-related domain-containing protein n=1 Tax=Methylomonas sp. TEB TaxID=3398229 RepID=UPI0039F47904